MKYFLFFLLLVTFSAAVSADLSDDFLKSIDGATVLDQHQKEILTAFAKDVLDVEEPLSADGEKWVVNFINIFEAVDVDARIVFSQTLLDQLHDAFPSTCRIVTTNELDYSCEYPEDVEDCLCIFDYSCDCVTEDST